MREITLENGNILKVNAAPFADAKALYQAMLREVKDMPESSNRMDLLKNFLCVGFSSLQIEACIWKCLERCTLNGLKVIPDSFEDEKMRPLFIPVCVEVTKENVTPFLSGLLAESQRLIAMIDAIPKST